MSEEDRQKIATVINSILMSNTRRMTIRQLNFNFEEIEGYGIPHQKFGCITLEQFLRTLKDKMIVYGSGLNAEVRVVVSPKAAHVNDLVIHQRKPKRKSRVANRKYCQNPNRRNFTYEQRNYNYAPPPLLRSIETRIPTSLQFKNTTSLENKIVSSSTSSKGAVPKQTSNIKNDVEDIYFSDEENIKNMKVPQIVQDRLWRLIVKHPDGILCSNILELYRKQYQETLSYSDYGYRSIAQMCVDLRSIFNIVQLDKSEIKLFDKRKPIPPDTLNIAKKLQLMKIKASVEAPTENAIPEDEVEKMMGEVYSERLPPEVVQLGVKLEKQWIDPGTNEQDYVDVYVGEVYDPSKFWINLKPYATLLNNLMDKMQTYYAVHKHELLVPYYALKEDLYVACVFAKEYHRSRIVDASQKNESAVKVYFVDYGTVEMVNIQGICYLHNQFAELPEQAIRARLAGIYPSMENEQWSRAVASRFLCLVLQKDLLAQLIRIDEKQRILDVVLADTSEDDEDFFINDALVAMGYANFTFQERKPAECKEIVPIVRYIHLYPTHYELENGLVPTAIQMINMHQAGLVIEQIYPHYFKDIKTSLPISSKHVVVKENLSVDYEIERPYYEENTDDICEERKEAPNVDSINPHIAVSSYWEDIIEEVELNSAAVDDNVGNDVYLQNSENETNTETEQIPSSNTCSNLDNVSENILSATEDHLKKKHLHIAINNSGHLQTDNVDTKIDKQSKINNTNIEPNLYQTNNYTQINLTPKEYESKTNNQTHTNTNQPKFKKPLRPPPGYNSVPTHNTVYNFNRAPAPNSNNYISSQTYINIPMSYYPHTVSFPMQAPHNFVPYPYTVYGNLLRHIQYLISCGARLTPDQQRYLQTFNWDNPNFLSYHDSYGVQTEFPNNYIPPIHSEIHALNNQNIPNADMPYTHQSSCQTSHMENDVKEIHSNRAALNPVAVCFTPNHVATSTLKTVDQSVQVDTKSECVTNFLQIENEKSVEAECSSVATKIVGSEYSDRTNYTEDSKLEEVYFVYDEAQDASDTSIYESQQSEERSENIIIETVDAIHKSYTNKEASYDINECHINRKDTDDVNEVESVYEECDSSVYYNFQETKFVMTISLKKLDMHVISLENEFYFLLTELSKKILPTSFTVFQLRKLFVGTPCIISVVDIRLKTNPDLKKELLRYDLIKESDLTVDAIPIKYFKDFIGIIPIPKDKNDKVNNLLEEIDCFLSGYSSGKLCL